MSWLSERLGVHLNLRPLAAPAGAVLGGLFGGTAGAGIGAGLFKAGDNLAHGDSWGHALGQGALNGGIAALGAGGLSALRSMFGAGSEAAGAAGEAAGGFAPSSAASSLPGYLGQAPINAGESAAAGGGGGFMSGAGRVANGIGSFLKNNPQAVAGGLQGLGQLSTAGSENAMRHAQVNALNLSNDQNSYDLAARKRRDQALAPLYQSFMGQIQNMQANPYHVASNPYS